MVDMKFFCGQSDVSREGNNFTPLYLMGQMWETMGKGLYPSGRSGKP